MRDILETCNSSNAQYSRGVLMFINLPTLMRSKSISNEELSKIMGIHRNTLAAKLDGESLFNLREIEIILTIFKEYNFAYIFAREASLQQTGS